MLMEWLDPSMEKQCMELFDHICSDDDLYLKFMSIIESMKKQTPQVSNDLMFQMENIFILNIKNTVDKSYRAGMADGLNLRK
jgi:hypothetical protein